LGGVEKLGKSEKKIQTRNRDVTKKDNIDHGGEHGQSLAHR